MTAPATFQTQAPKPSLTPVVQTLQNVLATTYELYLTTHNYHWNVEGKKFASLHLLFEGQYNELFQAVDVIGERIRALGDYVQPFEQSNTTQLSKMITSSLNDEKNIDTRADKMISNLVTLTESAIKFSQYAKEMAQKAMDDESENLMIERITAHQKALWMLKSSL